MKAYYAHCMALYNTPQEKRDIELIQSLGFMAINPSEPSIRTEVEAISDKDERMAYFERFADECDLVIFRGLPDIAIPSGVAKEIAWFRARNKPVLELPSALERRVLSLEATRAYLQEVGAR